MARFAPAWSGKMWCERRSLSESSAFAVARSAGARERRRHRTITRHGGRWAIDAPKLGVRATMCERRRRRAGQRCWGARRDTARASGVIERATRDGAMDRCSCWLPGAGRTRSHSVTAETAGYSCSRMRSFDRLSPLPLGTVRNLVDGIWAAFRRPMAGCTQTPDAGHLTGSGRSACAWRELEGVTWLERLSCWRCRARIFAW